MPTRNGWWSRRYDVLCRLVHGVGIVTEVFTSTFEEGKCDKHLLSIGNALQTEQEALDMVEELKVLEELRQASDGGICEIEYSAISDSFDIIYVKNSVASPFRFRSPEKGQKAIESIGEDRLKKYYFNVG